MDSIRYLKIIVDYGVDVPRLELGVSEELPRLELPTITHSHKNITLENIQNDLFKIKKFKNPFYIF